MNNRVFTSKTVFLAFGVCLLIWLATLPARTSDVPSVDKPDYNQPLIPLDEHAENGVFLRPFRFHIGFRLDSKTHSYIFLYIFL